MEKVSIIIPVYNGEKYIEECVTSILRQSYYDIELLVIDDGSTDKTVECLEKYRQKDSRIKIVQTPKSGPELARAKGLSLVESSEWVMFVDADDYLIKEDLIQKLVEIGTKKQADVICFDYVQGENRGFDIKKSKLLNNEDALGDMLCKEEIDGNMWCKLYRTQIVKSENVIFADRRNCDFLIVGKIFENAKRICVEPICGYYYRYVENSSSKNVRFHPREEEYEKGAREYYEYIKVHHPSLAKKAEYNWLKDMLYVCLKYEEDAAISRKDKRFKNYKRQFRAYRKQFMANGLLTQRDKILYWLCYADLFRLLYCTKYMRAIMNRFSKQRF